MADFPHLPLPQNVERRNYLGPQTPRKKPQRSQYNLDNRDLHVGDLNSRIANLESTWINEYHKLNDTSLQEYIDPKIIPIFLKVDVSSLDVDALRGFGIEIISQEEEGFVIGASVDSFNKLRLKIDRFEKGLDKGTAYLWEIDNGIGWKRSFVLSPELNEKLDHLEEDLMLELDISISCNVHVGDKPIKKEAESDIRYAKRLANWEIKAKERDNVQLARYGQFENMVSIYGRIKYSFDYNDSFGVRAELSVKGLKDILINYPYVFEITEHDYLEGIFEEGEEGNISQVQIVSPKPNAPKICIIDSGIMEGHRLLSPAIDTQNSRSYVPGEGTADLVQGGGHGTRVAGAALFPNGILGTGSIQLPFWIQNAKILNQRNELDLNLFAPELMEHIVRDFLPTRIYNLSVNSFVPCRLNHMSLWAAAIDKLIWENDVIFTLSVGNLFKSGYNNKPGIKDFINKGISFPEYLLSESFCRIANPSQSSFALSVGSVTIGEYEDEDRISFAKAYGFSPAPSPFSRSGLGLWGMMKPDVVELGGDLVREKGNNPNIIEHNSTSPHLVTSIQTSNEATSKDRVGTSFAAPKVASLVASLQQNFPTESCLFYRGLVVQSARLPDYAMNNPNTDHLRHFGYGIPNLERALSNNNNRVTLYSNGLLNAKHADIYSLQIPPEINRPGEDYEVLVELTLCYKANPRRTRMRTNSYLSHWLDWKTSKIGETFDEFLTRIINIQEDDDENENEEANPGGQGRKSELPWKIRERTNLGEYRTVKRQDSTVQKDWMLIKSYQIPDEIGIAILGHRGWSFDLEGQIPYSLFVSFEILSSEVKIDIYNSIKVANRIDVPVEVIIPSSR